MQANRLTNHQKIVRLVVCAMLTALGVVLGGLLSIPAMPFGSYTLKIGFGVLPVIIAGVLYGPGYGAIVGALCDLLQALIFPKGAYMPDIACGCRWANRGQRYMQYAACNLALWFAMADSLRAYNKSGCYDTAVFCACVSLHEGDSQNEDGQSVGLTLAKYGYTLYTKYTEVWYYVKAK